jgi:hypothetical protein
MQLIGYFVYLKEVEKCVTSSWNPIENAEDNSTLITIVSAEALYNNMF